LRVGVENTRHRSLADFLARRARGLLILWAGEIPFRYSDINRLPAAVVRACAAVQAALLIAALVGIFALGREGRAIEASLLALPIAYVSAVHFPLLTEARQSLPAMPMVLVLATVGAAKLCEFPRDRRHLPSKRKFMKESISDSHR
jgi:hypothetical protein